MPGHDNSNGSSEKSSSGMDDLPTFNAENMQNNMKVILYRRKNENVNEKGIYEQVKLGFLCLSQLLCFFPVIGHFQFIWSIMLFNRTFMAIIGGVMAGIRGLTSLTGFIFYFLVMVITSVALTTKAKFSIYSYFDSWNRVMLYGFFGGLMSFVLFWTFAYDIMHIF